MLKGWEAELFLSFVRRKTQTFLASRRHRGPLTVQRPFYPERGVCHVYLLHPPGGIVAGDRLSIAVQVAQRAEALVTTPAAGKFYRSEGELARQTVKLKVDNDAILEWLPQETIIYQGARLQSEVDLELATGARFIAWEIIVLGRPASGEGFDCGKALLSWRIIRNGLPVYLEKMRLDQAAFKARWGLNSHPVCGTMFASPADDTHLQSIRDLVAENPGRAVTLIGDLLICRAGGDKTEDVRNFFERVRTIIRKDIVRQQPYTPRIWAT